MKRLCMMLAIGFIGGSQVLWAIPSTINYQGTLKQNGVPASGNMTMTFQLTNGGGTPYSSSISKTVSVVNGLFSTQLDFTLLPTYTWETITPYISVSIGGQALTPAEPVNATVYSIISSSVVAGAITPASIAPGYGLVPSGMIALFTLSCPAGWSIFNQLQGKYPVGADGSPNFTLGVSTGSLTHNHSGFTAGATVGTSQLVGTPNGAPAGMFLEDVANQPLERAGPHTHAIPADSSLPPSLPMVFCEKT